MKELAVGTVLAERYEIIAALRAGGMGAVYRATDRHFKGRHVALKQMLDPEGRGDPEVLHRRFEEEANVLRGLSHPGVPQVYDFFNEENSHFIAMEFIHGDSLDTLLEEYLQFTGEPMPPAEAIHYALQVAEILTYLHTREPKAILHRDVKPSNIVRNVTTRRAVLVDFGLARDTGAINTVTLVGTLGYAAYEQVTGKPEVRSDIYGLGATLWHLLTGKIPPPFEIPPLAECIPAADPDVARIVDWATRYDVAERPPTALAYADALRELKLRLDLGRSAPKSSSSPAESEWVPITDDASAAPVVTRVMKAPAKNRATNALALTLGGLSAIGLFALLAFIVYLVNHFWVQ